MPANSLLSEENLNEMSLVSLTEHLTNSGRINSARVILPSDEELAVKLVDINAVRRLDELRSDEDILKNSLFTVLGAVLGAIVTEVTSEKGIFKISRQSLTAIVLLILVCFYINFLRLRASRKSNAIRSQIFQETT